MDSSRIEITQEEIEEGKPLAWISYLGILVIIPILLQRENRYTKFHIKQGVALLIVSIVWNFVWFVVPSIGWIGWSAILIWTVLGIFNALTGRTKPLPLLNAIAEKIRF